jgi:TRAP-type uncharacterized transport system fused permease subunit
LHGYLLRAMTYWERGIAIAAALLLVTPELATDIAGFGLMVALLALQLVSRRTAAPASVGAAAASRREGPHS